MRNTLFFAGLLMLVAACNPFEAEDVTLPPLPQPPALSVEFLPGDSNRVVVKDLSDGFFDRSWDFSGGIPAKSKRAVDTVFYPKAGEYAVTLFAAAAGGGGTAQNTALVQVPRDAAGQCDPQVALLTGDCEPAGKCWTLTREAGAVRVGPTYGSSEWYSSPLNGLQAAQYDDGFCFYFDGSAFVYANNGQTVDPFNGYAVVNYTPPSGQTWFISKGSGQGGADQIVLPQGAFLGVWDSGPVYDIVTLADNKLVVRSKILNVNGWFELTFVKM